MRYEKDKKKKKRMAACCKLMVSQWSYSKSDEGKKSRVAQRGGGETKETEEKGPHHPAM